MVSRAEAGRLDVRVDRAAAVRATRRIFGALLVFLGFSVMYGLAWDATWHGTVGRDKGFLSPPHALMYGSAAIAGLLCLAAVLIETARFRSAAGVNEGNSVTVLGTFHAPIGVLLAGFGVLTMVLAGPLDNYWHTLYGIFISAWHPFHMMGLIGGAIWGLGNLYFWSALLVSAGRTGHSSSVEILGSLAAVTVLLRLMMTISYPALTVFQTGAVGTLRFMTYPAVLALTTLWLLWVTQRILPGRRTGVLSVLLLLGFHGIIQLTIPWLVRTQAALEERTFLNPTLIPSFNLDRLAPDAGLLAVALLLGAAAGRLRPAAVGVLAGVTYWIVGAATAAAAAHLSSRVVFPPGLSFARAATASDALVALPITVIAAVFSAVLGQGVSEVLRRNPR